MIFMWRMDIRFSFFDNHVENGYKGISNDNLEISSASVRGQGGLVREHGCGRPPSNRSRIHFKLFFNKPGEVHANTPDFYYISNI